MRLDSESEVPGGDSRLIVAVPSLKGGMNSVPRNGTDAAATTTIRAAVAITPVGWARVTPRSRASCRLIHRTKAPSPCSVTLAWGNR